LGSIETLAGGQIGLAAVEVLKGIPSPVWYGRGSMPTRPFALGRRNWLFSDTVNGVKASASLYSMVQTARAKELVSYTSA
jgi:hypothetical protein